MIAVSLVYCNAIIDSASLLDIGDCSKEFATRIISWKTSTAILKSIGDSGSSMNGCQDSPLIHILEDEVDQIVDIHAIHQSGKPRAIYRVKI